MSTPKKRSRLPSRAVNHIGLVGLPVFANVGEIKTFCQVEVKLDGGELPFATDGVLNLQINLGPVERAATVIHLVVQTGAL